MEGPGDLSYAALLARAGSMPVDDVVGLGIAVSDQLAALHRLGHAHGQVMASQIIRTRTGAVLSDPDSPVGESASAVAVRSDVAALATVMWQLLAGYAPARADQPIPRGDVPEWLRAELAGALEVGKTRIDMAAPAEAFGTALREGWRRWTGAAWDTAPTHAAEAAPARAAARPVWSADEPEPRKPSRHPPRRLMVALASSAVMGCAAASLVTWGAGTDSTPPAAAADQLSPRPPANPAASWGSPRMTAGAAESIATAGAAASTATPSAGPAGLPRAAAAGSEAPSDPTTSKVPSTKAKTTKTPTTKATATTQPPRAPTVRITSISPGVTSLTVRFATDSDGLPLASCTATAVGGGSASGDCAGLTVGSLKAGVHYHVTVTVRSAAGAGTAAADATTSVRYGVVRCQDAGTADPTACDGGVGIYSGPSQATTRLRGQYDGQRLAAECASQGQLHYAYVYNNNKRSDWWVRLAAGGYIPYAYFNLEGGDHISDLPVC